MRGFGSRLPNLGFALLAGALVLSARAATAVVGLSGASQGVPLTTVEFSGQRYVVRANVGTGRTVPLMIHGNARMFLTLTHEVGEELSGGPVPKVEDYGYSSKGKGIVRVDRLRIGAETFSDLPPVPVFDYTESGGSPVQGMVGLPFLIAARAAVDFSRDALLFGVAVRDEPDSALLANGYRSVRMNIPENGRATLAARFPALGRDVRITPSTVSSALTLHFPLFDGKVPMTKAAAPDRSPSGTTPDVFLSERVDFEIAGVSMRSPASFEDFAEYGKVGEDELETFGMLGFDWMKEHDAILDYANRYLYFKP